MKKLMHQQNRLWDYQVLKQLGKGQYGQVFQVKLKKDNKIYALKKINIISMHQKQKIQAFRQIKALKLLSHPYIIQYHDSFLSMDNIYIVTEYAQKGDLSVEIANRIRKEKKFTEDQLWDLFQCLVSAIKHLHQKNIIHRDLKVENIFLTADGKYKIGDLGMSKIVYDNTEMLSTRVGTPIYFAPEVIQHKMYSFPVDIWALGCVFYYMAALQHPYKDATIQTLGYYIVDKDPKPIKGAYSPQLIAFIWSLLDKNPQTRPTIHDCYKKLKERKQQTIKNKISIFSLRQILKLKAQHIQQQNDKKLKNQSQLMSPMLKNNKSKNIQQRIFKLRDSSVRNQNPERQTDINQQKRNMSLYLPNKLKQSLKSSTRQYQQQCSSPMIKSNGFSLGLSPPSKNISRNKFKVGLNTVRYPNSFRDEGTAGNFAVNVGQSPSPEKREDFYLSRRAKARMQYA